MALNSPAFCSSTDLDNYLSAAGVAAFTDHEDSGSENTEAINQAINRATSRILDYAGQHYTADNLLTSQTVKDWCVVIGCYVLCGLRGSSRPESLSEDYQEICGKGGFLEQLRAGNYQIYNLPKRNGKAPAYANVTIDRRHPYRKIRVKPNSSDVQSSPQTDDLMDQSIDY